MVEPVNFEKPAACAFVTCLVNSSLFYWFYTAFSDCEHINDALIKSFNIPDSWDNIDWISIDNQLIGSLNQYSQRKIITTKEGHNIDTTNVTHKIQGNH